MFYGDDIKSHVNQARSHQEPSIQTHRVTVLIRRKLVPQGQNCEETKENEKLLRER